MKRDEAIGRALARAVALAVIALAALVTLATHTRAEEPEVPIRLQAELLAKVVGYDRGFAGRAEGLAVVLILIRAGDPDSERVGKELSVELQSLALLGRVPHEQHIVRYSTPQALLTTLRDRRASIVYVSAGLADEAPRIASALAGVSVLSVSAIAKYVAHGIVLGFSAESGKPRILVHLAQARRQGIDFRADLLRLAKVLP